MKKLAFLLAAALCAGLCASCQSGDELQAVKALSWRAPSAEGVDCSKEAWTKEGLNAKSVGPFRIAMRVSIDQNAMRKAKNPVKLLSFAGAHVELRQDLTLRISRMTELRVAGKDPSESSLAMLGPELQGKEIELRAEWTGQEFAVYIDGSLWIKIESVGTRCWSSLSIGPFPGRLRSVELEAR